MTHDELVERIKEKGKADFFTIRHNPEGQKDIQDVFKALLAVAEIPKEFHCSDSSCCSEDQMGKTSGYNEAISDVHEAIEKALI